MREANVSVSDGEFEAMGIGELIALGREAGIREFEELACRGTGAIVQVVVESRYDEERLAELSCVDDWEYVSETDDGHLYVIEFTAPELPESLASAAEDLIGTCDPELSAEETTMSLVGSQESISGTIREYEAAGVSPDLRKLGSYEGTDNPGDTLTDRQHEVIQTAYDMGFYEVPREASTDDVAAELDLDPSTVAEHLQRAERNVLSEILE
ncbi:bacterio-opsin activator HTH domain-containing protein [Halalkaliarchaeum desulfuricum]|uniref:Bacterio-opsin activator HTH domain-containing protein n=1 Tax=Halalkaliarchaeum desulfuricum TaxID=2055893 RepID=A0A343TFF9_9EURY|nr:helix-turn-helix domain-containing protein [Halalkaliarchaeum desulfuricum]AUX07831.1 bacterio-opsin activator HTH domain-containing protein [Halalkaliarchaeum desulfuricum]